MRLRVRNEDVEFGPVFTAPGVPGLVGEGHPYQRAYRLVLGDIYEGGITPAYKTFTMPPRDGNMPLREDGLTPRQLIPRCVKVRWLSGHTVNCVGLSSHGARFYFDLHEYEKKEHPFVITFMSAATKHEKRMAEWDEFIEMLAVEYLPLFPKDTHFAIVANHGCPNVGVDHSLLFDEINEIHDKASRLTNEFGIPIGANFSPVNPLEGIMRAANHPKCAFLWIGNTIRFGYEEIDWQRVWGSATSPLLKYFPGQPGGLSGPACLEYTIRCILALRAKGVTLPIVGGNGIQSVEAAALVFAAGADAIALGIVGLVRPWRVRRIIKFAHEYYQVQLRRLAA
jgi:dihydroorotate dehydrogenase